MKLSHPTGKGGELALQRTPRILYTASGDHRRVEPLSIGRLEALHKIVSASQKSRLWQNEIATAAS